MSFFNTPDPKIALLRSMALFAGATKSQVVRLAAQMDEITVGRGSVLTHQGRPGHSFYIVIAGEAVAHVGPQQVATFGPGDFFGEISMIDRDPAVATVTASTECTLLVLGHEQFRRALAADPDLEVAVTIAMRERLWANRAAGLPGR